MYFYFVFFIVLHELCHFLVARKLGYLPKKIKLTMFGASLEGFDDFLLFDEIKIVIAGPAFNLFMIVICYLCFWFYPESFEFLNDVLLVNQSILIFNLLPIFPLDAGRFALCLCSVKRGRRDALKLIKKISFALVIILFIFSLISFFVFFNLSLGFVSVNLCVLLFESCSGTSFKREIMLEKKIRRLNRGVPQKVIYLKQDYPQNLLLKFIDGEGFYVFIFVDKNFIEKGRIDERELLEKLGFI